MSTLVLPSIYAVLLWWFLTGAILYLNGLPRWTFKWSMAGLSVVAAFGFAGIWYTATQTSVAAAYGAFTFALLLWGWQEAAFLFGYATGPRKQACPPRALGWARFRFAFLAVLYHELSLLLLGSGIAVLTWQAPNRLGLWTFAILWIMRMSAKLNVYLGVRNLNDGILPDHLLYLQSYFRRKACNALFPFSIVLSSWVAALIWNHSFLAATAFDAVTSSFAATLLTLAILEHWFMVLPFSVDALWKWGLRSRAS